MRSEENEKKSLMRDQRGAVLAEFAIALVPLLTIFFVFVQISAILSFGPVRCSSGRMPGCRAP